MNYLAVTAGRAKGALIYSVAGTAWLLWGVAAGLPSNHLLLGCAAVIGCAFVLAARKAVKSVSGEEATLADSESSLRAQRQFKRINIAQWGAIVSIGSVLALMGRAEFVPPVVVAIVGIHFIPLGFLFHSRSHLVTGGALLGVACASPFMSSYIENQGAAGIGAGVILLLSSAYSLAGGSAGVSGAGGGVARGNG